MSNQPKQFIISKLPCPCSEEGECHTDHIDTLLDFKQPVN
jgi:hypothetical protein